MLPLTTEAPAKVNLTLRVLGKRPDGYHELYSLTAFAGVADTLTLTPADTLSLTVAGATASDTGPEADNLVQRAARNLQQRVPGLRVGAFHLTKRLPVAAGIGGGSSDAAGALRLLAQLNDLASDDPRLHDAAIATGADVRVCLEPRARIMAGLGDVVGPVLAMPELPAVLVNPRVAVPTPEVFRQLAAPPLAAMHVAYAGLAPDVGSREKARAFVLAAGNDLEPPAMTLCAGIGESLELLRQQPGCWLARMSGSGATTFALFDTVEQATAAERRLTGLRPHWWISATTLR